MFAFSFVIQVADIVSAGTAAWEDTGQECQVSQPPPRLIKPIRPPLLEKQRGRGSKDQAEAFVRPLARTC